jgi:hypothetical protein
MRTSSIFFAIATWMVNSTIARPIDTSIIDGAVAQVEIPDTIQYIDCDPRDPNCSKFLSYQGGSERHG